MSSFKLKTCQTQVSFDASVEESKLSNRYDWNWLFKNSRESPFNNFE